MAKALLITKENIVKGAVKLINDNGWLNLNARSLAKHLGISTKPLYRIYNNMDEIKKEVNVNITSFSYCHYLVLRSLPSVALSSK